MELGGYLGETNPSLMPHLGKYVSQAPGAAEIAHVPAYDLEQAITPSLLDQPCKDGDELGTVRGTVSPLRTHLFPVP